MRAKNFAQVSEGERVESEGTKSPELELQVVMVIGIQHYSSVIVFYPGNLGNPGNPVLDQNKMFAMSQNTKSL